MNNGIKMIFAFSLGAAAGSAVAWKLLKTKYERITQEEIDSVKDAFSRMSKEKAPEEEDPFNWTEKRPEPEVDDNEVYTVLAQDYTNEKKGGSDVMNDDRPYVIPPDEFGDDDELDTISLTYYADKVLVKEVYGEPDEIIENVEEYVGPDALDSFGEYEEDSVFVKNDKHGCYYEILLDERKYRDIGNEDLDLADDE